MAGRPKTRARREREARKAEREAKKDVQHPQAKPGSPEWAAYMAERRRQKAQEREQARSKGLEPEPDLGDETQPERDEREALNLLRGQLGSNDEKIKQTAAIRLLDHLRKDREDGDDGLDEIVYETAFAPEAYDLLVAIGREEAKQEVVPRG